MASRVATSTPDLRDQSPALSSIGVGIGLVVLTLFTFSPTLENGFVNWDDQANFVQNENYRGLGWDQTRWAATRTHLGAYQPLGWIVLSVEYAIWGLDPTGYHLVSILLHVATVLALYALVLTVLPLCSSRMVRGPAVALGAGFAVAAYAVHPLRVEAVAWASGQTYVPCALFFVLAVHAYICGHVSSARRSQWLTLTMVCFVVALSFKAPAVSLPLVMVILDVFPLRRLGGVPGNWFGPSTYAVWREKVAFLILGHALSGVAVFAKASTFNGVQPPPLGLLSRGAAACYAACFYIVKTINPRNVAAYYAVPGSLSWRNPLFLTAIIVIAGLTALLIVIRRKHPGLLAAWAIFLSRWRRIPASSRSARSSWPIDIPIFHRWSRQWFSPRASLL